MLTVRSMGRTHCGLPAVCHFGYRTLFHLIKGSFCQSLIEKSINGGSQNTFALCNEISGNNLYKHYDRLNPCVPFNIIQKCGGQGWSKQEKRIKKYLRDIYRDQVRIFSKIKKKETSCGSPWSKVAPNNAVSIQLRYEPKRHFDR